MKLRVKWDKPIQKHSEEREITENLFKEFTIRGNLLYNAEKMRETADRALTEFKRWSDQAERNIKKANEDWQKVIAKIKPESWTFFEKGNLHVIKMNRRPPKES